MAGLQIAFFRKRAGQCPAQSARNEHRPENGKWTRALSLEGAAHTMLTVGLRIVVVYVTLRRCMLNGVLLGERDSVSVKLPCIAKLASWCSVCLCAFKPELRVEQAELPTRLLA